MGQIPLDLPILMRVLSRERRSSCCSSVPSCWAANSFKRAFLLLCDRALFADRYGYQHPVHWPPQLWVCGLEFLIGWPFSSSSIAASFAFNFAAFASALACSLAAFSWAFLRAFSAAAFLANSLAVNFGTALTDLAAGLALLPRGFAIGLALPF